MSVSWPSLELLSDRPESLNEMLNQYLEFRSRLYNHTCCNSQSTASASYVVSLFSKLNELIDLMRDHIPEKILERRFSEPVIPRHLGSFANPIPVSNSEDGTYSTETEPGTELSSEYDCCMIDDDSIDSPEWPPHHDTKPIPTNTKENATNGSDTFYDDEPDAYHHCSGLCRNTFPLTSEKTAERHQSLQSSPSHAFAFAVEVDSAHTSLPKKRQAHTQLPGPNRGPVKLSSYSFEANSFDSALGDRRLRRTPVSALEHGLYAYPKFADPGPGEGMRIPGNYGGLSSMGDSSSTVTIGQQGIRVAGPWKRRRMD